MSRQIKAGPAAPDLSGRAGWIALDNRTRIDPILFGRPGQIRVRIIGADEEPGTHFIPVTSLPGPVWLVAPESGEESEDIGEEGDWIIIYRSGLKELLLQVLPGVFREAQTRELARNFPDMHDWPEDWQEVVG